MSIFAFASVPAWAGEAPPNYSQAASPTVEIATPLVGTSAFSTPVQPSPIAIEIGPDDSDDSGAAVEGVGWTGEPIRQIPRLSVDAAWDAGLAAWRSENYDEASLYFESVARSDRANPWLVAGGAFWAARANLFAQRPSEVSAWLAVAADCTETFYGLLARRILGLPMPFQWDLTEEDEAALAAFNQSEDGQRALALMQQSRQAQAEQLLMGIAARGRPDVAHGAMIVAENSGMADLAFRLQRRLKAYGVQYAGAQYPIPSWVPDGGFSTDRALIYALMRQESSFNPRAVSRAGARD